MLALTFPPCLHRVLLHACMNFSGHARSSGAARYFANHPAPILRSTLNPPLRTRLLRLPRCSRISWCSSAYNMLLFLPGGAGNGSKAASVTSGEVDMKTLCMKVDDSLYSILLAMLNGLPKDKITILETDSQAECASLMRYAGSIAWPVDGVEYQRQLRDEEW